MIFKVLAKAGLKIPFMFVRKGKTFDTDKTTLSKAQIAELVKDGVIEALKKNEVKDEKIPNQN